MPAEDQLEIIDPQGRIRFYPLDPAKGITNIGRHLDNDIVINRPGVAAFHAMLDHRSKPFHLVVLAQREKTVLDGEPAPINIPTPLTSWASFEIGGHQLIYLAGDDDRAPEPEAAPAPSDAAEAPAQAMAGTPAGPLPPAAATAAALPTPAPADPTAALGVEYSTRALAIDPGHTATVDVTIVNGGYKPLTFAVAAEGVEADWLVVSPAELDVPARQRSTVSITLSPPRTPATHAGASTLTLTVTTPAYPDWKNQSRLALTVNPFSEFSVTELKPRTQPLGWRRPFAQAAFDVTNRSNADLSFRITGEDERYACRYEFRLPDDTVHQPRQAELRLAPDQKGTVSARITPITRYRVGVSPRRHFYTVTVAPQGSQQLPRSVLGEVREEPLVGPLPLALLALLLAALSLLVFRPTIATFNASPTHVNAGQEVTLTWSASPFSRLRVNPDIGPVPGPDGRMTIVPTRDTIYTLVAENALSWINPDWFRATREVTVLVDPVLPGILFTTDHDSVTAGESITLSWNVTDAESLVLSINGLPEAIPAGQHNTSRIVRMEQDTVFVLQAHNKFTPPDGVSATLTVRVVAATEAPQPTRPAQPVVTRFDVSPAEIVAGQQATIVWSVTGVDRVFIEPLPGEFPSSGNIVVTPQQTTAYVLTASSGDTPVRLVKQVVVNPAPGAPRVDSFTATPAEVAPGSPESRSVRLSWAVSGETTDIQIAGPGMSPAVNLPAQGELSVAVDATATFTLTALNGSLATTRTVQVTVSSPAPTLINLGPGSAAAGSTSLTLTVTGASFVNGSVVQWNGSPRSTTYVGPTQLLAAITAADLANAGTASVTVSNPAPGGGISGALPFTINNPAPVISSLAPNSATAGGPAFALAINGTGFNGQSLVRWNGSTRTVSSATATQLTVLISAADIASAGTATVSVVNPIPGGGSDAAVFMINAATATPTLTPSPTPTVTPTPTATATP